MSRNYSIRRDLSQLEQMTDRLEDYLVGDQLYLPLAGNYSRASSMPQLTLGALLLRRRRLTALRATLEQKQQLRLDAAASKHAAIQAEWTLHYGEKLKQEVPSRLSQMAAFFRDCKDNPAGAAAAYPPEALRRTFVQEIILAMAEFGYDEKDISPRVGRADTALRRVLQAGPFIWSPEMESVYPRPVFWWLYAMPATR